EMHAGLETRNDRGEGAPSDRVERHVARAGQAEGEGTGGIGPRLEADEGAVLEPPCLETAVGGTRRRHRPEQELRPELGEAAPGGPRARAGLEVDGQRRRAAELVLPRGEQRIAALAGVDVEPQLGAAPPARG